MEKLPASRVSLDLFSSQTALSGVPPVQRNMIEREFLGPEVDDPASQALRLLLSPSKAVLPMDLRMAWVRFLISLVVRLPSLMSKIRRDAASALRDEPRYR